MQGRSFVQFEYNEETKEFQRLQERGELRAEREMLHIGGSDACKVFMISSRRFIEERVKKKMTKPSYNLFDSRD